MHVCPSFCRNEVHSYNRAILSEPLFGDYKHCAIDYKTTSKELQRINLKMIKNSKAMKCQD